MPIHGVYVLLNIHTTKHVSILSCATYNVVVEQWGAVGTREGQRMAEGIALVHLLHCKALHMKVGQGIGGGYSMGPGGNKLVRPLGALGASCQIAFVLVLVLEVVAGLRWLCSCCLFSCGSIWHRHKHSR